LPLELSKNQRRAFTFAYFVGGGLLSFLLPSYWQLVVVGIYYFAGSWILTKMMGGQVQEKTYSFPYPKQQASAVIPKVMADYHGWRKKILVSNSDSGHFSFQIGSWAPSVFVIDVNGLDEKTCFVKARCEINFFIGVPDRMIQVFFNGLNAALVEAYTPEQDASPKQSVYRPLEFLTESERRLANFFMVVGFILTFTGLGLLFAPQYGLNFGVSPFNSLSLALVGCIVVVAGLVWVVIKTRAWK